MYIVKWILYFVKKKVKSSFNLEEQWRWGMEGKHGEKRPTNWALSRLGAAGYNPKGELVA